MASGKYAFYSYQNVIESAVILWNPPGIELMIHKLKNALINGSNEIN